MANSQKEGDKSDSQAQTNVIQGTRSINKKKPLATIIETNAAHCDPNSHTLPVMHK